MAQIKILRVHKVEVIGCSACWSIISKIYFYIEWVRTLPLLSIIRAQVYSKVRLDVSGKRKRLYISAHFIIDTVSKTSTIYNV